MPQKKKEKKKEKKEMPYTWTYKEKIIKDVRRVAFDRSVLLQKKTRYYCSRIEFHETYLWKSEKQQEK